MLPRPFAEPDPDPDLHAYVDDELLGDDRTRIEREIASEPRLRAKARAIVRTRNLIANLPRPCVEEDLSGAVLRSIEASSQRRIRARLWGAGVVVATACAASVAAVFVGSSSWREPAIPVVPNEIPVMIAAESSPSRAAAPVIPETVPTTVATESVDPPEATAREVAVEEPAVQTQRERMQELLNMGARRQLTIMLDDFRPANLEVIDKTIREARRRIPQHARISRLANAGLIENIEPGAVYYTVVMDSVEHESLLDKLNTLELGAIREADEASAEILAALGQVEAIEMRDGKPHGTLMRFPPDLIARADLKRRPANPSTDQVVGPDGRLIVNPLVPRESPRTGSSTGDEVPDNGVDPQSVPPVGLDQDLPLSVYVVCVREHPRR